MGYKLEKVFADLADIRLCSRCDLFFPYPDIRELFLFGNHRVPGAVSRAVAPYGVWLEFCPNCWLELGHLAHEVEVEDA